MKWLIAFVVVAVGFWTIAEFQPLDAEPSSPIIKQKGVCWVASRQPIGALEIEALAKTNTRWISQTPFAWQSGAADPTISMNTSNKGWWGESDEGIEVTTRIAKEKGIQTMLKPHLWVRNGWPGDIAMKTEEDWQLWFQQYETFILHYARLAQQNQIEILCIGTELQQTTERDADWRNIIQKIREVYGGKLIYAANFHDEFEKVQFWDELDYIGIQGYFPLASLNKPSLETLKKGWEKPMAALLAVYKKFSRPIIFTEVGYRSSEDAAIEPWKWPQQNADVKSCVETQALCYQAFFETVWQKDWVAGAYFWKWYPHGPQRMAEIDFTPQGKLAETVLTRYYKN